MKLFLAKLNQFSGPSGRETSLHIGDFECFSLMAHRHVQNCACTGLVDVLHLDDHSWDWKVQRVEVVEMRLARSDHSTLAIVRLGVMECTFFCHTIALLMIYSCSGGKSNKRSDVSKYCILYNWMNSGEDIMVLIDHLKRQLRNHGTSICRKVCLEVLKEAWTPRERFPIFQHCH